MSKLEQLTDWQQLQGLLKKRDRQQGRRTIDEAELQSHLRSRVKGQDKIIADVAKVLRLQMGKQQRSRPICNLLFLGPTGTGKTELAKAIAEYLFGDEKTMLRFDCSEFSGPEAKARLIGVPSGYVSAEMGGQLTRPVIANPRRLILFDEIEKAFKDVFDLFLQLMGEGRLTEQGSGKTADFTQCTVILTSNAHAEQIAKLQSAATDDYEQLNAVKSYLADAQVLRPEILGRIDRVYVFSALEGIVVAEIAMLKIVKLASQYGVEVEFIAPELIVQALAANDKVSRFGIRELERILDSMFAPSFAEMNEREVRQVKCQLSDTGELIVVPSEGTVGLNPSE